MTRHGRAAPEPNELTAEKAFGLSRIRAAGWRAGQQLSATDADTLNETELAAMNPYTDGDERERWASGFMQAIGRRRDKPAQILKWKESH